MVGLVRDGCFLALPGAVARFDELTERRCFNSADAVGRIRLQYKKWGVRVLRYVLHSTFYNIAAIPEKSQENVFRTLFSNFRDHKHPAIQSPCLTCLKVSLTTHWFWILAPNENVLDKILCYFLLSGQRHDNYQLVITIVRHAGHAWFLTTGGELTRLWILLINQACPTCLTTHLLLYWTDNNTPRQTGWTIRWAGALSQGCLPITRVCPLSQTLDRRAALADRSGWTGGSSA